MEDFHIVDIDFLIQREELLGRFFLPFEQLYPEGPRRFRAAEEVAERCLAWTTFQWLNSAEQMVIRAAATEVIAKSIRLHREEKRDTYWRNEHDVMCGHLAATACDHSQRHELAERMVYAEGTPSKEWSLYAWSGFMKFSLLGDRSRARSQAEMMFSAGRPINLRLPRKPLVRAWLDEDWPAFNRAMKQSFSSMWANLRKNGRLFGFYHIGSDGHIEISLTSRNKRVEAHWQENALAILAWEKGVVIPTDPMWLPSNVFNDR